MGRILTRAEGRAFWKECDERKASMPKHEYLAWLQGQTVSEDDDHYDPEAPTYACSRCLEQGYVIGEKQSFLTKAQIVTGDFCWCSIGQKAKSDWHEYTERRRTGRRLIGGDRFKHVTEGEEPPI